MQGFFKRVIKNLMSSGDLCLILLLTLICCVILGNELCNSEPLLSYKKPPWICGINQQLFYSARRFPGSGNLDTGIVGWLVLAYRCLRPRIEKLQGCGSLGSGGWNYLQAHSLTWLAVEAAALTTYLHIPSACSAGVPHSMMARSPKQATKRKQAKAIAHLMTYPEKSRGVTSARVTSPAISERKEHIFHLSVGQGSKITL